MIQRKFKANRPRTRRNTDITPYWKVIEKIINDSDVVLEVIDARMPELSRSEEIEHLVRKKRKDLIIILNKTDLIPKESIGKEVEKLKKEFKAFDISFKDKKSIGKLRDYLLALGKKREWFNIGVVGYPNTGKSSIINSLVRKKSVKVTSKAGTTHGQQWVALKSNIRIIDSPGVIPLKQNDEVRYALIGSRNPEKIKNLDIVAYKIIELFKENENLKKYYKISIESNNPEEIINEIGRKKGFLKKGNEIDETRVAINIVRDWQFGKLRL